MPNLIRVVIHGTFPDVLPVIREIQDFYPLVLADPPYGNILQSDWDRVENELDFTEELVRWARESSSVLLPQGALYLWGGIGKPGMRPFLRAIVRIEEETDLQLANWITWKKKRAYGVSHNYLFTREEIAYFVKGDIKKPRKFEVPLLDAVRSYAGYNPKYPARSQFYRRTSVWDDVTEILRGKTHEAQKPKKLHEIPILVHTNERETVLDPFAGSLMTGLAATSTGRGFVLVEKDLSTIQRHLPMLPTDTKLIEV